MFKQLRYIWFLTVALLLGCIYPCSTQEQLATSSIVNDEGVFNIHFSGSTSNKPRKSLVNPILKGISISVTPGFWSVKGSFYFCVSSSNSYVLNKDVGLRWKENNHAYSSFSLFNFTLYESEKGDNFVKESMILNHGTASETHMLESVVDDLLPYERVKKHFCYVPDPWSLISDERDSPSKYRIEKFVSGTYYFEPIEDAVVSFGSIPFTELIGEWSGPVRTIMAPVHLIITSNITEAFTLTSSLNPVMMRTILPRCVEFGLELRCFTYFYTISSQPDFIFNMTFYNAETKLDFPLKGKEEAYVMVNHDSIVFDSRTLTKREDEMTPGSEEVLSFCTYNVEDLDVYDKSHESYRNLKLSHIMTLKNTSKPIATAAAAIYQATENAISFAIGISYGSQVTGTFLKWVGTEQKLPQMTHQIQFSKKFAMNCNLLLVPPKNLPIRLNNLKRYRKPRDFVWFIEPKLKKMNDYMTAIFVSRVTHLSTVIPEEGLGRVVSSSSRFILLDLKERCTNETIVEVENTVEYNEYVESTLFHAFRPHDANQTCHKFFIPLNGTYLSPEHLDVYAYHVNQTRPRLVFSGVVSSRFMRFTSLLIALGYLASFICNPC